MLNFDDAQETGLCYRPVLHQNTFEDYLFSKLPKVIKNINGSILELVSIEFRLIESTWNSLSYFVDFVYIQNDGYDVDDYYTNTIKLDGENGVWSLELFDISDNSLYKGRTDEIELDDILSEISNKVFENLSQLKLLG
jgi:hypothetical protein